ncbi:MAG: ABC transporter ATP-binding protein [Candidatus Thermoplasmatota archaeon]|jgi:oligopeptide/dipeptide ABC transporter ATP-binding protein|nr:ABC transporter ATP-binding protein [Candidatus Thermoplasmatota archaeon]MCL5790346.1 ABC transporter ATP-binding protein [Candidatus Thermoplasmatota archaeon]
MTGNSIMSIRNLSVGYNSEGGFTRIINNLNLEVNAGRILGIAGESGSGKSTLAQAIYRSLKYPGEIESGEVIFDGRDLLKMELPDLRKLRAVHLSFVPQAAMNALNPVKKILYQFFDVLIAHGKDPEENMERIQEAVRMVRLDESILYSFPHELSGGMKQRTVIAMSLLLSPKLVILDEPTTGLDVLVEHDILKDIREIQRKTKISMIFITHDLSILYEMSDDIGMLYAGELVEKGKYNEFLENPMHPYTYLLTRSIPRIGIRRENIIKLKGTPTNFDPDNHGCQFISRCPFSESYCSESHPELIESDEEDHYYRCVNFPAWKRKAGITK